MDEPLDIRKLTEDNIDEIAQASGRTRLDLERKLQDAKDGNREVLIIVNNPVVYPRRPKPRREDCYYDATWSEKVGWTYICVLHKKPSWHSVTEFPSAPCTAIDPKPSDV